MPNAKRSTVIVLATLIAALVLAGGCNQTPAQKLYLSRQAYIGTEQAVTTLIRAKVIKAGPVLDGFVALRDEARAALSDADASIGTINFNFVMARVESVLGRFAQYYLDHRRPADITGEPGATTWIP